MSNEVSTDPVVEAIAKKLSGINGVPAIEQERMIREAAKAGAEALHYISRVQDLSKSETWLVNILRHLPSHEQQKLVRHLLDRLQKMKEDGNARP